MAHSNSAVRALSMELKGIQQEPVEGFLVRLRNDDNLFEWEVAIYGPPRTLYEGGYFKALLKFPCDYPYSPPTMRFLSKVWHPNVYENGDLCISILHPPVDDPQSGELARERWNPTQNVRTILLSVISLLNEPNTYSPANVDASVMYRKWKESKDKDQHDYAKLIRQQVAQTAADASRDGVTVPTTLEEYCIKTLPQSDQPSTSSNLTSLLDSMDYEEYYDMDDDDDDEEDDDETTSGEESEAMTEPETDPQQPGSSTKKPTSSSSSSSVAGSGGGGSVGKKPGCGAAGAGRPNGRREMVVDDNEDSGQGEN